MTEAQRMALSRPCVVDDEMQLPWFSHASADGIVILTVNSGYE